ncbi:MAG: hypothetical protein R3325_13420 [Thermoanaerobaculia bacterium]|nr:hypothetical protein [Thermoanaerobaculia bacterium]
MRLHAAVGLALVALLALPAEAAKTHKNFVLYNETGGTIEAFYFSPSDWDDWGENQLADGPLYDGEWIWNRHNHRERYYDLRVEFDNGYAFEIEGIDLTEVLRVYLKCNQRECWAEYAYE